MMYPSIFANCAVGACVAFFFVLYYINGEAKGNLKVFFELLIGTVGNGGLFFLVDTYIPVDDDKIRLIGLACCFTSFLVFVSIFLVIFAFVIKGKDVNNAITLRDIFLGQYSYINKRYEQRSREIDEVLKVAEHERRSEELTRRENELAKKEKDIDGKQAYIEEELARIEELGKKKLRMKLPENSNITLNQEYIATMPSYIENIFSCIHEINNLTDEFLKKSVDGADENDLKAYLLSIATHISVDLLGAHPSDGRVHFRIYDKERNGYVKYVAVMGGNIEMKAMTFIPYDTTNMIARSYECKRALIKSLNFSHHYEGKNYKIWKEYLTYAFTDLTYEDKPFLSFGISIKNVDRFKKELHFINYFQLETFLQQNLERVNAIIDIASILYGGVM